MTAKRCSKCGEMKSLDEFYSRGDEQGLKSKCKTCHNKRPARDGLVEFDSGFIGKLSGKRTKSQSCERCKFYTECKSKLSSEPVLCEDYTYEVIDGISFFF